MSNRTFACPACRKLQRKSQSLGAFACPACGQDCVRVDWKLHVPAPRKLRKWNRFWDRYLSELRQIRALRDGVGPAEVYCRLLNQTWVRQGSAAEGTLAIRVDSPRTA